MLAGLVADGLLAARASDFGSPSAQPTERDSSVFSQACISPAVMLTALTEVASGPDVVLVHLDVLGAVAAGDLVLGAGDLGGGVGRQEHGGG